MDIRVKIKTYGILNDGWVINLKSLRDIEHRRKQLENMKKQKEKPQTERCGMDILKSIWSAEFVKRFNECRESNGDRKNVDEFDANDYKLMCKRAQHDLDRCNQNREYYINQITHYGAVLAEVDKEIDHYKRIVEVCTDQLENLENLENSDD